MGRIKGLLISVFSLGLLGGLLWLGGILSEGVRQGILLCLTTVLPSLFLFTVLTNWMGSTRILTWLGKGASLVGRPVLGLGPTSCGVLLFSLLGGYPVGAALLAQLVRQQQMDSKQASKMLCFCSWSSPAFLIQGVGGQVLGSVTAGVILWLSQLAAALLLAALLRVKDAGTTQPPSLPEPSAGNFFGSLRGSLGILGGICGTVILCSGLFPLLDFLPLSPLWDWTVRGMAEVTNGCFCLPEGVSGFGIFCRLGFFAAFGGICIFCQNALLVSGTGISLKWYLASRVPIGLFCAGFCALGYSFLPQQTAACFGTFSAPAGAAALSSATPLGSGLMVVLAIFLLSSAGKRDTMSSGTQSGNL